MSAAAWDDIPSSTLLKSWNKLLHFSSSSENLTPSSSSDTSACESSTSASTSTNSDSPDSSGSPPVTCELLAQQLIANLSRNDLCILTLKPEDANDPGYQLLSDGEIIEQVTATNEQSDSDDDEEDSGDIPIMLKLQICWISACFGTSDKRRSHLHQHSY